MSVEQIIDSLGGDAAVAARFDLSEKAVWQWRNRRSIPGRWHLSILRFAQEQGVSLSDDDLLAATNGKQAA